jgi:serine/threonine protein kinase
MGACPKCKKVFSEDNQFCPDDGTRLSASANQAPNGQPSAGWVIDAKYALEQKLGEGGMGTVWRARHIFMEKPVALKLLKPIVSDAEEVTKRFAREAKLASQLDEPHVCAVYDCGRDPETGILYLAMEYLEGQSLRAVIDREKRLPAEQATDIIRQLLAALGAAHQIGIVHRDIKPENIMLVSRGPKQIVKLLDFGVAKQPPQAAQTQITRAGFTVGTPEYIAPEQALAGDIDGRADIYAAGVIFYELLAGRRPFVGDTPLAIVTAHVQMAVKPLREVAPEANIPREVEQIVLKMLAKEPENRYQDADSCRAAIRALTPTTTTTNAIPAYPPAPNWLRPAFFGSAAASVIFLLLLLIQVLKSPESPAPGTVALAPVGSPAKAAPAAPTGKGLFQAVDTSAAEKLLANSNFDEAKAALTKLAQEDPKSAKVRELLTLAHAGKGEWYDARLHTEVQRALEPGLKPSDSVIELALNDIATAREARRDAAENFLLFGYGRAVIPSLDSALKKDASKRKAATNVLGDLSAKEPLAVGILVKALPNTNDCADRANYVRALIKAPRGEKSVVTVLQAEYSRGDIDTDCRSQKLAKAVEEALKTHGAM